MNIKELRSKAGLSQKELSEATGIPKGRINAWEQRGTKPKAHDAKILEDYFTSLNILATSKSFQISFSDQTAIKISEAISESFKIGKTSLVKGVLFTESIKKYEAEILEMYEEEGTRIYSKTGNEFIEIGNGRLLMTVPLIDQYAQGGYLTGWKDPEYLEDLNKHSIVVDKQHKGIYRAFEMRGDSMDDGSKDAICSGDIVTGRSIPKHYWNSKFHLHRFEDYVIIHEDGIIVKRIINHDVNKGIITCFSLNLDKDSYPDFEISLSEVHEIYNIVSVERKRGA